MSDENAQPVGGDQSVDIEAIKAQVRQSVMAEMQTQFDTEKQAILTNKDQILEEKRQLEAKVKGVDDGELEQFREFQKRIQQDEMLKMAANGQFEELSNKLMSSREKAWNETQAEYEERLSAAQSKAEEQMQLAEQFKSQNLQMQKRQYFKDLTMTDDSFKSDHFGDFFELQQRFADIDETTGNVYALDEQGKRRVDTDGNFVSYQDYYSKLKVTNGLFWSGGSGTGIKGGQGGEALGADPLKWTLDQKKEYIAQNGRPAYSKLLAQANANRK